MAETMKQTEALPAEYPTVTAYAHRDESLLPDDVEIDASIIWQRIEAYIAYRWTPREVVWLVEGEGDWTPPLTPATITASEVWESGGWSTVTLMEGPYGYDFAGDGPYRITATVGGGELPEAVEEAFWRLHEYSVGIAGSFREEPAFRNTGDTEIVSNWTGKALQLSGAADLLRPYRRAQ